MLVIGLTGSIGMGKSTTATLFREAGVPVFDADAAVHSLYEGVALAPIAACFPEVILDGRLDRDRLRAAVFGKPERLRALEAILHPLVRQARERFVAEARAAGETLVVLDVPLLFETGSDAQVDKVVVVSVDEAVQKRRVLERPGMTAERLAVILEKQMPDAEKRRRADAVIDTGSGIAAAREEVAHLLARWRSFKSDRIR